MSLTQELRDRKGPVARFFIDRFPNIRPLQEAWRGRMKGVATILPAGAARPPWSTIGEAIDHRLRYYIAETPPRELLASRGASQLGGVRQLTRPEAKVSILISSYHPAVGPSSGQLAWQALADQFFDRLGAAVREIDPVGRRLDAYEEALLCRYCYVLGLFEELYRAGAMISSPLYEVPRKASVADLLAIADPWLDDLRKQSWAFYDGHRSLLSEEAVLNPTFEGSLDILGADADLILGGCLLEFKTAKQPMTLHRDWVEQLLGYLLLDYQDEYKVEAIGIYMTRQAVFVRWELDDLPKLTGSDRVDLPELRAEFRNLLQSLNPNPLRSLIEGAVVHAGKPTDT